MTSGELARLLEKDIHNGKYKSGKQLPVEASLADMHGVSVTMVREALAQLVGKGLVKKFQGIGTFVI